MTMSRQQRAAWVFTFMLLAWVSGVLPVLASTVPTVPISELVNDSGKWNNKSVELTGEAIGDIMKRGDDAWLNVSQDGTVLGFWGKADLFKPITHLGDYSQAGDTIRVTGEFHTACPEHGGDMDVHITRLEVVHPGTKTEHPVKAINIWLSLGGAITAAVLAFVLKIHNRRRTG